MPTTSLPGIGAWMRIVCALKAMARSSWRFRIFRTGTFGAGLNSKVVTTGPEYVRITSPSILNLRSFSSKSAILLSISLSLTPLRFFGAWARKSRLGSLKSFGAS